MTNLERIEREVQNLHHRELTAFREWFREFDADLWDQQIKNDAAAGKLDGIAEEAIAEHHAGNSTEL